MNKKFLICSLALAATLPVAAQKLTAKSEVIDCGQVLFRHPVTAQFELKNSSHHALTVNDVRTSCGCVATDIGLKTIQGNGDFKLSATYDAKQMGHFEKQIAVYSDAAESPLMLTLKGVVVSEVRDYAGGYEYTLGMLKADRNTVEFDDVNIGDRPFVDIHIQNASSSPATPVMMHLPNYLKAEFSPSTIAPGHAGVARVTLLSNILHSYGLTQTSIYLGAFPGDKARDNKEITVSTVLLPSFQNLSESELVNAPQIRLSARELDFRSFEGKKKKSGVINIENVGRSTLEISSMQMFTSGLKVALGKTKLAPGEQTKLKITAERKELRNVRSQPRVLMITNDPANAKVVININLE